MPIGELGGNVQSEPRLAAPARARDRQQTNPAGEHGAELGELSFATDEGRRSDGEVCPVEAPERRELLVAELVDTLRGRQVLGPVLAQIMEAIGSDQVVIRLGEQVLTAVAGRSDP